MADINKDPCGNPAGTRTWRLTLMAVVPAALAFSWGAFKENEGVMAAATAMFGTGLGVYATSRHLHKKQVVEAGK